MREHYSISDAPHLLNNNNPNTHYAVFRDHRYGEEFIGEINAPTIDEAINQAMEMVQDEFNFRYDFAGFLNDWVEKQLALIQEQKIELVGGA
tara:strand:- start:269 stop:544 length:276 start_codon:yes stop_codon:yes gene_type:complete